MPLTLVTGRANAGKTGAIHDALRAAAGGGRRPLLLLPTQPDVLRTTAEFSHTLPVGLHVGQLDAWASDQWDLRGDGRAWVEPAQRAILLAEAVASTAFRALSRSAATPGFRFMMTYVVRRAAEESSFGMRAEPRTRADAELLSVVDAYRTRLQGAGLIEPAEATRILAAEPPRLGSPLFAHRFSDLTPSQEALLVSLSASDEVWISLPWEEGFPATEALTPLADRLSTIAAQRVHKVVRPGSDDTELARLEAGLFQAPEPHPLGGGVRFCTAAGAEAEATLIAEQAADAARRFGAGRVAIVFRDAARHAGRLGAALAGAGVPADLDVLLPVSRTAFGVAMKRLLRAVATDNGPASLTAFLRSPFAPIASDVVDGLDARWRGRSALSGATAIADASRSGRAIGRVLKVARRVTAGPVSSAALGDWKELADTLLSAAHDARALQEDSDAGADAAAHRALLDAVSRLAEIGDGRSSHTDVLAVLEEAHASPAIAERPGHVQVTEAHRLRTRRFDAVIVGGLTAGDFSAEGRSSSAAEIADRLFGTQRASDQAHERLLFYNVCTRARELLVLTRRTTDSEGVAVRPSVFWEEALDLYRTPSADAELREEEALLHETVHLSDLDRAAPALTPGRARLRAQASARSARCDPRVREAIRRGAGVPGRLEDVEVLERLAAIDEFSVTELETYARCPYRWFYERVVRPGSLDVAFDALSRGDLAHRTLADFYSRLAERAGTPRVSPEVLGTALELADEAFDRAVADSRTPARRTLAEEDAIVRTRASVRALVTRDQHFLPGFAPAATELRFGTALPDALGPPGGGPVDVGGLRLRGSIDRVDVGESGLVVIDYKTSTVPKLADFSSERVLQVPLYAAVASRLLGVPTVAGLYRSLKSGESRGFFVSGAVEPIGLTGTDALSSAEEANGVIEAAVTVGREAADGIRSGAIPSRPASARACDYCAAAPVCGKGG
jgi:RecB family exonuclease